MNKQDLNNELKSLSILHGALCSGVVLILLLFAFVLKPEKLEELNIVYLAVGLFAILGGIGGSMFMYRNLMNKNTDIEGVGAKFSNYRSASIIRYALIEGPAFFNLVLYFISGEPAHLYIALAAIVVLVLVRPTKQQFETDAQLTGDERRVL